MPIPQRLPLVDGDDGEWGDILNQFIAKEHVDTGTDVATNGGHKKITVQAGTATAGTAPLKFTSGTLLTTPEAGAIEFLADQLYFTQTTSTTRKKVAAYDDASGATGDMYYRNSSGVFTRLPVGSSGEVLTSGGVGPIPTWAAPASSSPVTTKGDLYTFSGVADRLAVGSDGQMLIADSNESTGLRWADQAFTAFEYDSTGSQVGNRYNNWSDLVTTLGTVGGAKTISFTRVGGEVLPAGSWDLGDTILTSGTSQFFNSPIILDDGFELAPSWTGSLKSIAVTSQSNSTVMVGGSNFKLDLDDVILLNQGSAPLFQFTDANVFIFLRNLCTFSSSPSAIFDFAGTNSELGILALSGSVAVDTASITGTVNSLYQEASTPTYNNGVFPVFGGLTILGGSSDVAKSFASLVQYTPTTLSATTVQAAIDELATGGGGGAVSSVNTLTGAVVLTQDEVLDGPTYKQYSATEKTKLAGIATGATANNTDAYLLNRANHTGTQSLSTIASVTATTTELNYTGGVTSAIQTQLNSKAASSHTHLLAAGATDVTATATELNYSSGVTSAIQTQLNAKAADSAVVHKTGTETIAGVKTFSSLPVIPDTTYGAGWSGSLEPATKNALYTKIQTLTGTGDALTTNPLSQFAATTSAQLRGVLSDETGTGAAVFATAPTFQGATVTGTLTATTLTATTSTRTLSLSAPNVSEYRIDTNTTGSLVIGAADATSVDVNVSNGTLSVGSVLVPTISSTATLTNKRVTPRVGTTTSTATPAINTDTYDYYEITALAANITSFTMTGTPTNAQKLWIAITGTAARTIAWGSSFEASTVALPTTTVTTARLDVGFIWNSATSKWRCVAVA